MQSTFIEHYLPNGLRVVCEVLPRVRSAAAGFCVQTGARHETPDQHGISHFLEHMCFKGSAKRGWREINVRFDELGSIYNAFTGKERTVYYGWVPATRLVEQLELLSDLVRPILPPDEYETERKVILEEIAMTGDNFEHHVGDFLHKIAFRGHALAHEILGEKETIEKLPRAAMVDYHRTRYQPDNMFLVASGALDPQALFAAAGRYCGDWQRGAGDGNGAAPRAAAVPVAKDANAGRAVKNKMSSTATAEARHAPDGAAASKESKAPNGRPGFVNPEPPQPVLSGVHKLQLERFQQQALILLYPSVPNGHAHEENIETFVSLFGGGNSRCFWNIVQKGIAQHAGAAWLSYQDCGLLALYAYGEPPRCEEMLAALRAQAKEVSEKGFRPDEVQRVKNQRRTQLALEGENPRTRLMQLLDDIETHNAPRPAAARLAEVEAVSEKTIAAYLREFPVTGEGLLLSVGPREWP